MHHLARNRRAMDTSNPLRILPAIVLPLFQVGLLQAQPASQPDEHFWAPNGPVHAMAETNGVLYLGGEFTRVSPITGGFVPINPTTGATLEPFEKVSGTANAAIPDGNGGWFVGGTFNAIGSSPRTNLVHLRSDRSVDPAWVVIPNGPVTCLTLVGQRLFFGGEFTEVNGQERLHLAEVNSQTGALLPLHPALDGKVLSLATDGTKLFLGGLYTSVMGTARTNLSAIDLLRNVVSDWQADCDSTIGWGVTTLKRAGDRLYVGGDFSTIGASNRHSLAALEIGTGRVLPWNPNPNGVIAAGAIAVLSNRVYVAGGFDRIDENSEHPFLAAIDADSGHVLDWNSGLGWGTISAMALVGDSIYVCREEVDETHYFDAIDVFTGQPKPCDPRPTGPVRLLAPGNDSLYVGGEFHSVGGITRNLLAALDVVTGRPTAWDAAAVGGAVYDLALSGETLFAAGSFESIGGESRVGVAAVSLSDGAVRPFTAQLFGFDAAPAATRIAVGESNVIVGGNFDFVGDLPATGLAVLDLSSGDPIDWNPIPDSFIAELAVANETLYLSFVPQTPDGGDARLAAFDLHSRLQTTWRPSPNGLITSITFGSHEVFLGGEFTRVNNQDRLFIASTDANSGDLRPWHPLGTSLPRSTTIIGSTFYSTGDEGRPEGFDLITEAPSVWTPLFNGPTRCLLASRNKMFVGGSFSEVDGKPRPRLAAFTITNLPPSVTMVAPSDPFLTHLPAELELSAAASDSDGIVVRVDYYANGQIVASSSQPPYSAVWRPRTIGRYEIAAVATDNVGGRGMSGWAQFSALPPTGDIPPTVVVTSPLPVVQEGSDLRLAADVADPDSRIDRVEFFLGTNAVAVVTNRPYSVAITNLATGRYSLTVIATDEYGVTATNGPVVFRLNSRPTVSLGTYGPGPYFAGTNLPLTAFATDRDGVVQTFQIFSGHDLATTGTNGYLQFTYNNLQAGSHTFTAIATDDLGGVGVSSLTVVVVARPLNDAFSNRFTLPPMVGHVFGSNTFASREPGERPYFGNTGPTRNVWWTWTPDFTGPAFFSTRGSSFPTILAVYTGDSISNLNQLAIMFVERPTNRITLPVVAGTSYQIAVDSATSATGPIVLTVGPEVILRTSPVAPQGWELSYDGPTNLEYVLQSSTNAGSWSSIQTNRAGAAQKFLKPPASAEAVLNRLLLLPTTP